MAWMLFPRAEPCSGLKKSLEVYPFLPFSHRTAWPLLMMMTKLQKVTEQRWETPSTSSIADGH